MDDSDKRHLPPPIMRPQIMVEEMIYDENHWGGGVPRQRLCFDVDRRMNNMNFFLIFKCSIHKYFFVFYVIKLNELSILKS